VEEHPLNRAWLAKHPKVDAAKGDEGVQLRGEAPGLGTLDLAFERDALEVLRLGSYFGTCLGLGGMMAVSAAAIAMDVNKRVVYARNAAGRPVARQLVAVAEDDRLVCFSVYPQGASKELRRLFRDYDQRLAEYLGLTMYERAEEGKSGEYEIAATVSQYFWDDEAWDFGLSGE